MKTWTQQELDALIDCEKRTIEAPRRKMREEWGSYRNEATLESTDDQHRFRVFFRQNAKFPENFTIGLDFISRDEPGSICLLRCNGPHGPHRLWPHHSQYHIHRAKAENLNEGMKAEAFAEVTKAYASFPEAILHFGSICHILNWQEYFPSIQTELFPDLP